MTLAIIPFSILNDGNLNDLSFVIVGVSSAVVGGLVASRRPRNPVGWIFLGSALFASFRSLMGEYAVYGILINSGALPLPQVAAWFSVSLEVVGPILFFILLPLYFPNGRAVSPRWNLVAWFALGLLVVGTILMAFSPGEAVNGSSIPNPLGFEAMRPVRNVLGPLTFVMYIGLIFAAAASLVVRFRRARGAERQQIKWIAFAAAIILVWFMVNTPVEKAMPEAFAVMDALVIAAVPIAAGIAILRYRLYDIDILINKTLVYGSLTALLALLYFGGVASTQAVFRVLTGQESSIAVVASTLIIAALFIPLRRRIQNAIDRRFYRKRYDAAKTLAAFSAKLREETDLENLNKELVTVVRDTMQPEHVSLWLRHTGLGRKGER